jgi:hypothetical protein
MRREDRRAYTGAIRNQQGMEAGIGRRRGRGDEPTMNRR